MTDWLQKRPQSSKRPYGRQRSDSVPRHLKWLDIKRTRWQRLEGSLEAQGRWGSGLGKSGWTVTEWASVSKRDYPELKTWNSLAFSAHQSWDACTVLDSWTTDQWGPVLDGSSFMAEEVVSTSRGCIISTQAVPFHTYEWVVYQPVHHDVGVFVHPWDAEPPCQWVYTQHGASCCSVRRSSHPWQDTSTVSDNVQWSSTQSILGR